MSHATNPLRSRRRARAVGFRRFLASTLMVAATLAAVPASANFQAFLDRLWVDASARGVPRPVFDRAFAGIQPDPAVIELTKKQAEFTETTAGYLAKRVSDLRIEKGRKMAAEWAPVLAQIEQRFGVDRHVVLSVWGNETNYGGYLGGHSVIRALATLSYAGYRGDFFRKELLNALDILAQGHVAPENMVGSWAGAMGHTQFMPSSFKALAVDMTGDNRRDIWTSIPDALASTANYLKRSGWRGGETWGYEVELPPGFDYDRAKKLGTQPISAWQSLGARRPGGQSFPRATDKAWLIAPARSEGPAILALPNFKVIKRYNNSDKYALAVGHLADRIRGAGSFVTPWAPDQYLALKDRQELQALLSRRGYPVGSPDGRIGGQTIDAIRAFQMASGMPADGNPTPGVLQRLRTGQ